MIGTRMTGWDVTVAVAIVVLAVMLLVLPLWIFDTGSVLVVTTPEGSYEYPLSESCTFSVESRGMILSVVIEDGEAFVSESGCPDGVCLRTGRISRDGETVLCAPAGVTLTVRGGGDGVDFVAG